MNYSKFHQDGYLIIKNYYSVLYINNIFKKLKNHFFLIKKKFRGGGGSFNKPNEALIPLFYNSSKKLPVILDLLCFKKNLKIARKLIKSNNCGFLNRGFGFRFDYPAREKYLTQLHQDYHANLGSPNGLVFYTPITSINNKKQGPVVVYQGSHKEGIRKVFISKSYNKSTSYIINLKKDELSLYNKINLYLDQGDLAIFDFRLLHESSKNLSSKVRISFIHRYFDFNNLVAKRNKFIGGLQEGNFFEDFHPDLVV